MTITSEGIEGTYEEKDQIGWHSDPHKKQKPFIHGGWRTVLRINNNRNILRPTVGISQLILIAVRVL